MNVQRVAMVCFLLSIMLAGRTSAGAAEGEEARKVPVIPPKGQPIRVIIDSDAKNETDWPPRCPGDALGVV